MNDSWMKAGPNSPAHWIKLSGNRYFVTACQVVIPGNTAQRVPAQKISLANAPGRYFSKPLEGETCQTCEQKAREQA